MYGKISVLCQSVFFFLSVVSVNESAIELQHGFKNTDGIDSPAPLRFEGLTIGYALRSAVNVAIYTADQEDRKMVVPSRFAPLPSR